MKIKILQRLPGKMLIEWQDDGLHRGTIPEELVDGERVDDACLSLAIPYGVDFEAGLDGRLQPVTPKVISDALHDAGIWTYEDMARNPGKVQGVLMTVYGIDFQLLIQIAQQSRR